MVFCCMEDLSRAEAAVIATLEDLEIRFSRTLYTCGVQQWAVLRAAQKRVCVLE